MQFLDHYQSFLSVFNPHLTKYLSTLPDKVKHFDKSALSLIEVASFASASSGKRLRPYLVSLGYQIASSKSVNDTIVLNAAMVSELFHSFAVIHDDIIDKSDTRRNQKTSHIIFEEIHKNKKLKNDAKHFGTSMAILAGDLQIALSLQIISELKIDLETKQKLLSSFSQMFTNLVIGQYQDVYQSFEPKRPNEQMIMSTLRWKSGEYTIEFPLEFGALLGGADRKLLEFFAKFAVPIGIAFQLKDDLLGIFSNSQTIGKSNLSDILEGKNTLLVNYAYANSNPDQKKQLDSIIGNENADEKDLKTVQDIMIATGAKSTIEQKIEHMTDSAITLIKSSNLNSDYQTLLSQFAEYIIRRDK